MNDELKPCPMCGIKKHYELKPCPFCGSKEIAVGGNEGTVYRRNTAFGDLTRSFPTMRYAYCCKCGASSETAHIENFDGYYNKSEQEKMLAKAIDNWNRRVNE